MQILPFDFKNQKIRTFLIDNEPWFVAKDIAKVLEIKNISDALSEFDDDEKSSIVLNDGTEGNPSKLIISESGLYSLIMRSRKPVAKPFQKWVTREVLPEIRKTGSYSLEKEETKKLTPQKSLEILQTGNALLSEFKKLENPLEKIQLDNFHKNETGESNLDKFGIHFKNSYFLPTEIGKMVGQTGAEINLILEKKGFQFQNENEIWTPTGKGKELCLEIGNRFNQLKWRIETIL